MNIELFCLKSSFENLFLTDGLLPKSEIYVFGWGQSEEYGNPENYPILAPTLISSPPLVVQVSCGEGYTSLVTKNGEIYTFGSGEQGVLGHGNEEDCLIPTRIANPNFESHQIIQASCGSSLTAFVTKEGEIYTFGDGILGRGNDEMRLIPTVISGFTSVTQVSCGGDYAAFLTKDGKMYTFGSGEDTFLGHGDREERLIPTMIFLLDSFIIQVSCGFRHTAFVTKEGTIYTFGCGKNGKLGHGDEENRLIPTSISFPDSSVVQVSCGYKHTAFVTHDGIIYTFGCGNFGQLGHEDMKNRLIPTPIDGFFSVAQVSCGEYHTAFVTHDGMIYTFGCGNHGQLGHGDKESRLIPTLIRHPPKLFVVQVSCGSHHTALIAKKTIKFDF
jgi:RCC1 and BTB domain-containing protein